MYLPGLQSFENGSSARVTPIGGQLAAAGVREAFMGADGTTSSEFPSIIRPRGFSFDGSDDLVTVPNNAILSFGDGASDSPFSIAVMAQFDDFVWRALVSKGDSLTDGEYLFSTYGGVAGARASFICVDDSAGTYIGRETASGSLEVGIPYVLIGTYSGSGLNSGIRIYTDGARTDTTDDSAGSYTAMEVGAYDVKVGDGGGAINFDGDMLVPPMIFDFELTPAEVASLTDIMRYQYATSPR
jgi:hypothetical protein